MSSTISVKFPNEYDNKDVSFPLRDSKLAFVDVITKLQQELLATELGRDSTSNVSTLPLSRMYITIGGVLWKPEAYLTANNRSIVDYVSDYTDEYIPYSPPEFMPAFIGETTSIITTSDIDEETFTTNQVAFNYYATVDIVDTTPNNNLLYRIVIPSKVARKIITPQTVTKPYTWEFILELESNQYDPNRLVEWATWLFNECIVYDNTGKMLQINYNSVDPLTIASAFPAVASILEVDVLDFDDFAPSTLQHPVVEYYMFKRWGTEAVLRLHQLLTNYHSTQLSSAEASDLEQYLKMYLKFCDRAETTSIRPPCWPYRNPASLDENLFISTDYARSDVQTPIHDFIETYPFVEEVNYLPSMNENMYTISEDKNTMLERLMNLFPLANNLCQDGVLLAGTVPSMACVDELYAGHCSCSGLVSADLFVYGKSPSARYKILEELIKRIEMYRRDYKIEYSVCKNMVRVSFWRVDPSPQGLEYHHTHVPSRNPPNLEVQIIYTEATCKAEVLYNFDSSYIQVGYEKGNFYATSEFHYFTPRRESLIMRSSIQLHRLLKIIGKGFLPVLDQPMCHILGTRKDLPRLTCTSGSVFVFEKGNFLKGINNGLEQVKITQKYGHRGSVLLVENIHFIELPPKKETTVELFHLMKSIRYQDLKLNTYNSYSGHKLDRLKIKKAQVYKALAMPEAKLSLIDAPMVGTLLVSDFDVAIATNKKDKRMKRKIESGINNAVMDRIAMYEQSLKTGKLVPDISNDPSMKYRLPQTDEEMRNAVYVVNINGVDTYPSFDEINSIISREKEKLNPIIGVAYFDINVRIGEKCKNGVKLDGREKIHIAHEDRILFKNMRSLNRRIMRALKELKDGPKFDAFLKRGFSFVFPVKAYYVKTTLEDRYIGPDEKSSPERRLDPNYNHTAVVTYCPAGKYMYFNVMRVTKHLQKTDMDAEGQFYEVEESDEDHSDHSSSEDSSSERERSRSSNSVGMPTRIRTAVQSRVRTPIVESTSSARPLRTVVYNNTTRKPTPYTYREPMVDRTFNLDKEEDLFPIEETLPVEGFSSTSPSRTMSNKREVMVDREFLPVEEFSSTSPRRTMSNKREVMVDREFLPDVETLPVEGFSSTSPLRTMSNKREVMVDRDLLPVEETTTPAGGLTLTGELTLTPPTVGEVEEEPLNVIATFRKTPTVSRERAPIVDRDFSTVSYPEDTNLLDENIFGFTNPEEFNEEELMTERPVTEPIVERVVSPSRGSIPSSTESIVERVISPTRASISPNRGESIVERVISPSRTPTVERVVSPSRTLTSLGSSQRTPRVVQENSPLEQSEQTANQEAVRLENELNAETENDTNIIPESSAQEAELDDEDLHFV
jgi:hypothetical protein